MLFQCFVYSGFPFRLTFFCFGVSNAITGEEGAGDSVRFGARELALIVFYLASLVPWVYLVGIENFMRYGLDGNNWCAAEEDLKFHYVVFPWFAKSGVWMIPYLLFSKAVLIMIHHMNVPPSVALGASCVALPFTPSCHGFFSQTDSWIQLLSKKSGWALYWLSLVMIGHYYGHDILTWFSNNRGMSKQTQHFIQGLAFLALMALLVIAYEILGPTDWFCPHSVSDFPSGLLLICIDLLQMLVFAFYVAIGSGSVLLGLLGEGALGAFVTNRVFYFKLNIILKDHMLWANENALWDLRPSQILFSLFLAASYMLTVGWIMTAAMKKLGVYFAAMRKLGVYVSASGRSLLGQVGSK